MTTLPSHHTVSSRFFAPLEDFFDQLLSSRHCPGLSDLDFIKLGVCRVLSQATSGRGFLQSYAESAGRLVETSHFFETLKSPRRLALCTELNSLLQQALYEIREDPFVAFPELAGFDLYAGDGPYHGAAAHDNPIGDSKQSVGHFFLLNLRSCAMRHLELGEANATRKHEHDMHMLKRTDFKVLRAGTKKGRKGLIVWDRAGVDFLYWHRAKQNGVYFLSREKENMRLETVGIRNFDRTDPRNQGVISDELAATSQGVCVRRIIYYDPVEEVTYSYLTSEMTLPAGLLVLLYKRRWDIEKVFDETENKLQEGKAWASSPNAKKIQGQLIAMTCNLMLLLESQLEKVEEIRNQPEIDRRSKRLDQVRSRLAQNGIALPFVHRAIQRITQRGLKLIRWLRNHIYLNHPWSEALHHLRRLYGLCVKTPLSQPRHHTVTRPA